MSAGSSSFSSGSSSPGIALIVVALHVGLIYGVLHLKSGSAPSVKSIPLQVAILAERQAPSANLLPPSPPILTPVPTIEPPVLNLPDLPAPERAITATLKSTPAAAPAAAPTPKFVSAVEYLRPLVLRYPAASRRLHEEGLVVLRVLIDEEGEANRIEVHQSSGYERLDRAARQAVSCAKFKPYVEDGIPRASFALIPVEFTLIQRVAQR